MNCNESLYIDESQKGLVSLQRMYGKDTVGFIEAYNKVVDHVEGDKIIPKADFLKVYKESHDGKEPDFTKSNIARSIRAYMRRSDLSPALHKKNNPTNNHKYYINYQDRIESFHLVRNLVKDLYSKTIADRPHIESRTKAVVILVNGLSGENLKAIDVVKSIAKGDFDKLRQLVGDKKGAKKINTAIDMLESYSKENPKDLNIILGSIKNDLFDDKGKLSLSLRDYYKQALYANIKSKLRARLIAHGVPKDKVVKLLKSGDTDKYFISLGGENISRQDANLIGVLREIYINPKEYFDNVFNSTELKGLKLDKVSKEEREQFEDETLTEDESLAEGGNESIESDAQNATLAKHWSGKESTSALNDIDVDVRSYITTIPKLHTPTDDGNIDPNLDNALGIIDYMDGNEVNKILMGIQDKTSLDSMLNELTDKANKIDGYQGLSKLVYDIRNNINLANAIERQYIRDTHIAIQIQDDKMFSSNSNKDPREKLYWEVARTFQRTATTVDPVVNMKVFDSLWEDRKDRMGAVIDLLNGRTQHIDVDETLKYYNNLVNTFRQYFPNISADTIRNFIESKSNGSAKSTQGISQILSFIKSAITDADTIMANRETIYTERSSIYKKNVEGREASMLEGIDFTPFEYPKRTTSDYISGATTTIDNVSTAFKDYVKTTAEINVTNAEGKMISTVGDLNQISHVKKISGDDVALRNKAKERSDISGIRYSMLTADSKTAGNGMFAETADGYVPTDGAKSFLSVSKFDGIRDSKTGNAVGYSRMNREEYLQAQLTAFENPNLSYEQNRGIPNEVGELIKVGRNYATYFMRTPSDAPKIFTVTMPKYSAEDLYVRINEEDTNNLRDNTVDEFMEKSLSSSEVKSLNVDMNKGDISSTGGLAELIHQTMYSDNSSLKLAKGLYSDGNVNVVRYLDKKKYTYIVVNGDYDSKTGLLSNAKIVGYRIKQFKDGTDAGKLDAIKLKSKIQALQEKNGNYETTLNRDSDIYRKYRDAFKYEIAQMLTVMNKYYSLINDGDGSPISIELKDDGNGNLVPSYKIDVSDPNQRRNAHAYEGYEINGDRIDNGFDDNGWLKFTSNVFRSNRFTLRRRGDNVLTNYGDDLLKSAFSIFATSTNERIADSKMIHATLDAEGRVKDIKFTSDQENAFAEMLDRFISDSKDVVRDRVDELGLDRYYSDNELIEYNSNYNIANYTFDELFEGDTKFYKNAQDFLKRAKEAQAGGIGYGGQDFTESPYSLSHASKFDSIELHRGVSTDVNGKSTPIVIKDKPTFKAITIKNSVIRKGVSFDANKELPDDSEIWAKQMAKSGNINIQEARKRIYDIHFGGGGGTKANDAQSYITFNEWVRRIAKRGQYSKYKDLINAILDESKPVDTDLINQFVQVQKNFYYEIHYDKALHKDVPRQIKNAEFVIIPRFVRGTELEAVVKVMDEYGIDELNTVETTKASKKDIVTIWDNDGNMTDTWKQDMQFATLSPDSEYSYSNLYTQQEPPQHVGEKTKLGIQIYKKLLDNIQERDKDGNITKAFSAKQKVVKAFTDSIVEARNQLLKEFGAKFDENGNLKYKDGNIEGLDYSRLMEKAKMQATRTSTDSNINDYFEFTKTLGINDPRKTLMPLFMGSFGSKAESVYNAIFNSAITRFKLNGFHGVQVTGIGFNKMGNTRTDSKLKYHITTDEKGNKKYASHIEVAMTYKAFGVDVNSEHYQRLREEARNEAYDAGGENNLDVRTKEIFDNKIIKELEEDGLIDSIGYRIPSEGKQSVAIIRPKYFLDDTLGSTIIVPDEWVAQTGSDFDVDSVYGMQHDWKFDKDGRVRKGTKNSKDADGNDIEGNTYRNDMMDGFLDILRDESSNLENLSASTFEDISSAIKKITGDENINGKLRSPYNPIDQIDYQDDVQSGAGLKAISVVNDNFMSVANTVKPYIAPVWRIKTIDENGVRHDHDKFGWSEDNKADNGNVITSNTSQTSAHAFDAVKNGSVPNVNLYTFGVYKLFTQVGTGHDISVSFIMQPAISRIAKYASKKANIHNDDYIDPIAEALRDYYMQYNKLTNMLYNDKEERAIKYMSKNRLIKNVLDIIGEKFDKLSSFTFNYKDQVDSIHRGEDFDNVDSIVYNMKQVLAFDKLNTFSNYISERASVSNPDKFGSKIDIFSNKATLYKIDKLIAQDKKTVLPLLYTHRYIDGNPEKGFITDDEGNPINFGIIDRLYGEDSAYPILKSFIDNTLKTSLYVIKPMFYTEDINFKSKIYDISAIFDSFSDKELTPDDYNEIRTYLIGKSIQKTKTISEPIEFNKNGKGRFVTKKDGSSILDERARVLGINTRVSLDNYEDGKPFTIKNFDEPTTEELEAWYKLTPAQKVLFIKEHSTNPGVFGYLDVNLGNEYKTALYEKSLQRIMYNVDEFDINAVHKEFEDAWNSNNILLKSAVLDLIKYHYIKENGTTVYKGIGNIISNKVLYGEPLSGKDLFTDECIESLLVDDYNSGDVVSTYVRSHSDSKYIASVKLKTKKKIREDGKPYDIITEKGVHPLTDKAYKINIDERQGGIKGLYKVENDGYVSINGYIKLTTNKNKPNELYSCIYYGKTNTIYLTPMNKLEVGESGEYSLNPANNVHPSKTYFDLLIKNDVHKTLNEPIEAIIKGSELIPQYSYISVNDDKANSFDLNKPIDSEQSRETEAFDAAKSQIVKLATNGKSINGYIYAPVLSKYITKKGGENGKTSQEIELADGTIRTVDIYRPRYIRSGIRRAIANPDRAKLTYNAHKDFIDYARKLNVSNLNTNVFKVEEHKEVMPIPEDNKLSDEGVLRRSTLEDALLQTTIAVKNNINMNDNARKTINSIKERKVDITYDSIKASPEVIINAVADNYARTTRDNLMYRMNNFIKDVETEDVFSIADPRVIARLTKSKKLQKEYLGILNQADAFVNSLKEYKDVDTQTIPADVRRQYDDIIKAIADIENSEVLRQARILFGNEFLKTISTNPLVQADMLNVLNGYYSTSFLDGKIDDLQNNANTAVQIVTNSVMSDIRAKDLNAKMYAHNFRKNVADIIRRAGGGLAIKDIVDKAGRVIQDYSDDYITDYHNLNDKINELAIEYGDSSIEVLKAKLDREKWLLANTHQKLDDDYYRRRIAIKERFLNEAPEIASEYERLIQLREDYKKSRSTGTINEDLENKIKEVSNQINKLKSEYKDGFGTPKDELGPIEYGLVPLSNDPTKRRQQLINSAKQAKSLRAYNEAMQKLARDYYERKETPEFRDKLDKMLSIKNKYEGRNAFGHMKLPQSELLDKYPEYKEAISWLHENAEERAELGDDDDAMYQVAEELVPTLIKETGTNKLSGLLEKAYTYLRADRKNRKGITAIYKEHSDYFNEFGEFDASRLTDKEIGIIKEQQETDYGIRRNTAYSDKGIINNSNTDDTVYKAEFYNGLRVGGIKNSDRLKKIDDFNKIAKKYYDKNTKMFHTSEISEEDFDTLSKLLDDIEGMKSKSEVSKDEVKRAIAFRKKYVDDSAESINQKAFDAEEAKAKLKGARYYQQWLEFNTEIVDGEMVPRKYLYGVMKPKAEYMEKFVDKGKTESIKLLNHVYRRETTRAFDKAYDEAVKAGKLDEFMDRNTVYNPYTHEREILQVWTKQVYNDALSLNYEAKGKYMKSTPKHINDNYTDDESGYINIEENYKDAGDNSKYRNARQLNEHERELRDYINFTMKDLLGKENKHLYKHGDLPRKYNTRLSKKDENKLAIKAFMNVFGLGLKSKAPDSTPLDYTNKGYDVPMMQKLQDFKEPLPDIVKPKISDYANSDEGKKLYAEALIEYHKQLKERKEAEDAIQEKFMSRDYDAIFDEFIRRVKHYNAIQDNKENLINLKRIVESNNVKFARNATTNNFKWAKQLSSEDSPTYIMESDERLKDQYNTWLERLYLDRWKDPSSAALANLANSLQAIASAKYMMLNLRGGISNILIGETNIAGEAFAKTYFDTPAYNWAITNYTASVGDFISNMYSDKSSTLTGAFIKHIQVVAFDEINGVYNDGGKLAAVNKFNDFAFSLNNMGEHMMQNTAMLAMAHSNKLIRQEDGSYKLMSKQQYITKKDFDSIKQYLTDDQLVEYKKYIEDLKKDAQKFKSIAHFREDAVTKFAYIHLTNKEFKDFAKKRNKVKEEAAKEFDKDENKTLYSQFKLNDDGYLGYKQGSILEELSQKYQEGANVDDANVILGAFTQHVIDVNKKIHGNYDKMARAQIEKYVWGSLAMQYHKHIYPGLRKRWTRQGYYNESRGSIEKGSYTALYDLLAMPFKNKRAYPNMSEQERQSWYDVQNMFRSIRDYAVNVKLLYSAMPEWEKANMRRNLGDLAGLTVAFSGILACRLMQSDTDKDSIAFNAALYQFDRLATEAGEFNPIGAISDFKTLYSSPIAAESFAGDMISSLNEIAKFLIEGEDYDGVYHSGIHAGESKVKVRLARNIPIYRQIDSYRQMPKNNRSYHIGDNTISFLGINPKSIAESIRGHSLD